MALSIPSATAAATTCSAEPFTILPPDYGLDYCVGNNLGEFLSVVAAASTECSLEDLLALRSDPSIATLVDLVTKMVATPDQISALFYQHMKATGAPQMDAFCSQLNAVVSPCAKTLLPGLLAIAQRDLACCSQLSDVLDLAHLVVPATERLDAFVLNDVVNGVNSLLCAKRDGATTCGAFVYAELTRTYSQTQFSVLDSMLLPFFTAAPGHECDAMSGRAYLNSASLATARAIDFGCCTHHARPLLESVQRAFAYLLGSTIDEFLNGVVEFDASAKAFVNAVAGTKACAFASTCTAPPNLIPAMASTVTPGTNAPGKNDLVDTTCTKAQKCDAKGSTCSSVCERGSVVVPTWLRETLAYERKLAFAGPLCSAQLPATHNSAITLADGYGNRDQLFNRNLDARKAYSYLKTNNQALSLTDQLELGVRWLEVDAHYFLDDLRTAHCGNLGSASVTALFGAIDAKLATYGTILWGPELLGCFPSLSGIRPHEQVPTRETLRELRAWLDKPTNRREALFLYLDTGSELSRLNKLRDLDAVVMDVFGDLVVPRAALSALAASQWANSTIEAFVERNQRVFVLANDATDVAYRLGDFCGGHRILDTKFIDAVPDASRAIGGVQIYSGRYVVRSYQSMLRYISLGESGTITQASPVTLDAANIPNYVRWNLNLVATDQLDGARMRAQTWSWAENEPATRTSDATVFATASGRWIASASAAKTWKACWSSATLTWRIVAFAAPCDAGFAYTAPRDPYQNYLLQREVAAQKISVPVAINATL